jgi:hypothetical protein
MAAPSGTPARGGWISARSAHAQNDTGNYHLQQGLPPHALDGHCDAETVARMMEGSFVRREAFEALRAEVEVLKKGRLR